MWMQGLELSLEVLDKMFMFDSFQNGQINKHFLSLLAIP